MAFPRLRATAEHRRALLRPRLAGGLDRPFASPVHELQDCLRDLPTLLGESIGVKKYPRAVRLILTIALSIALWWLIVEVAAYFIR